MRKIFFVLLLGVILPPALPMLNVEEAMAKIRQLENIPDLKLKYLGLDTELEGEELGILPVDLLLGDDSAMLWPCYVFKTDYPDNSMLRYYVFEPATGQIIQWYNPLAKVSPRQGEVSQMISKEEAIQSAIDFIKKWHPDFTPSQYIIGVGEYIDPSTGEKYYTSTIRVYFRPPSSTNEQGWEVLNRLTYFSLRLDSTTGNVVSFFGWHIPLSIPITPTLTKEQVEEIAFNALYNSPYFPYMDYASPARAAPRLLVILDTRPPYQRLIWTAFMGTYSNNPLYQEEVGSPEQSMEWYACVDVHTGEVVLFGRLSELLVTGSEIKPDKEDFRKAVEKSAKMEARWRVMKKDSEGNQLVLYPLMQGTKAYITIEQAWFFSVSGEEKDGALILRYKDKELKLGSKDIVRKDGEIYIPLDVVLNMAGYSAKYGSREKAIYVTEKAKQKEEKTRGAIGGGLSLSALCYVIWKFLKLLA